MSIMERNTLKGNKSENGNITNVNGNICKRTNLKRKKLTKAILGRKNLKKDNYKKEIV